MKKSTNGHGTLRTCGGVTELRMLDSVVCAVKDGGEQTVRIVVMEKTPGGAELEVKLSAEDAAHFASTIYALARTAIIQNQRAASEQGAGMVAVAA
jgi:hypothetical protein